jgi:hypothetical protein
MKMMRIMDTGRLRNETNSLMRAKQNRVLEDIEVVLGKEARKELQEWAKYAKTLVAIDSTVSLHGATSLCV